MQVKMLVVQGRPAGKSLVFPHGEYYFGRGAECQVRPNSDWVSRQHCLLRVTADEAFIRDLGSRNGTLINGKLVTHEHQLKHGDHVQIGPLVFEVQLDSIPPDRSRADVFSPLPLAAPHDKTPDSNAEISIETTKQQPVLPPDAV